MNKEQIKKVEIFAVICLLLVGVLTFFSYPGLTGHVSSDISTQSVDFLINQSQLFEITTDSVSSFHITSFRLSGLVIGDGIAEIYLDNRQGQWLLVFNNIRDKSGGMEGLTGITAKVVGTDIDLNEIDPEKFLIVKPLNIINQGPINKPEEGQEVFDGAFESECDETCFIDMEMNHNLGYNLIFRVEPGVKIHLTKVQYIVKEE